MAQRRKKQPTDGQFYRAAFQWMGIGLEFCIVIGAFVFGGYWLDQMEDTSPGWMVMGFFVGFGVMLYIMIKRAHQTQKELDAVEDEDREDAS